ncbi:hypothetical protein SKAU_G00061910 [Synaphobranchus kaupii]|uniref:Uncharacterized protein n=1 Tax=Synaphobranchus kaupii TaxID=118154 RepID=A0A9Q1G5K4_SYNKA|nr:hypothetical protein SKAU_G00061910 [Synaphobranchus kaupii]
MREVEAWEAIQEDLLSVSRSLESPISSRCTTCHVEGETVTYRCRECGPCVVLCDTCVTETHRNSLHLPDHWKDCSSFQAGNLLRSKNKQRKLDVTGVFGASCRHEMPIMFLNMAHGERLGYPLFVIEELLRRSETEDQSETVRLHVVYDIACVLAAHLQNSGNTCAFKQLSLAVPAFHIYGHKASCQI